MVLNHDVENTCMREARKAWTHDLSPRFREPRAALAISGHQFTHRPGFCNPLGRVFSRTLSRLRAVFSGRGKADCERYVSNKRIRLFGSQEDPVSYGRLPLHLQPVAGRQDALQSLRGRAGRVVNLEPGRLRMGIVELSSFARQQSIQHLESGPPDGH